MPRLLRPAAALLALLALATPATAAPPDPLTAIPDSAQVVVKIENPRALAEAITTLDAVQKAQQLAPVKQILDTPTARRLFQMLAFAEFSLGAKWPVLLDRVAGGGVALAFRYGADTPVILVIQGTDDKLVAQVFDLAIKLIDEELTRQGAKNAITRGTDGDAETVRIGDDLHAARIGSTVLISNKAAFLKEARDTQARRGNTHPIADRKSLQAARKLLPKDPLAWLWLDFAAVKELKEAKDFFDATRTDFLQTLVAGSTIDCLRRSDFVAVGLYQESTGFRLAVRLPAGREGLPPEFVFHVPPKGTPGSLPLLEPPGVIYSQSFHLDIGYYWKNREKLINKQMLADLEMGIAQVSKILPGSVKFGELLEMWGGYHRIVVVNHDKLPYKTEPGLRLPAFGYVTSMRDPRFGQTAETILRAAGIVGTLQFDMKMTTTEHEGVKIVGYRFPENKPLADDTDNIRFNFELCFAIVGDQLVVGSTVEVCRKLITELKRPTERPSAAVWRAKGYSAGAADFLAAFTDPLVTDAVLSQGIGLDQARKQVGELVAFVRGLGTARLEMEQTDTEYRFDIVLELNKPSPKSGDPQPSDRK